MVLDLATVAFNNLSFVDSGVARTTCTVSVDLVLNHCDTLGCTPDLGGSVVVRFSSSDDVENLLQRFS